MRRAMLLGLTAPAMMLAGCSAELGASSNGPDYAADSVVASVTGPDGDMKWWIGGPVFENGGEPDDDVFAVTLDEGSASTVTIEVFGSATDNGDRFEWAVSDAAPPVTATLLSDTFSGDGTNGSIHDVKAEMKAGDCDGTGNAPPPVRLVFELFDGGDGDRSPVAGVVIEATVQCASG